MFLEIYLYEILISNEDWMAASCKLSKYITLKLLHSWRAVAVVAWLLAVLLHVVIVFGSMAVALSGPLLTLIIPVLAVRWPLRFLCSCSPCSCCCGSSCCCCGTSCWWSQATATDSTRLPKKSVQLSILWWWLQQINKSSVGWADCYDSTLHAMHTIYAETICVPTTVDQIWVVMS